MCLYIALLLSFKRDRGRSIDNGRKELKEEHTKEGSGAKYNFEHVLGSKWTKINVKFSPLIVSHLGLLWTQLNYHITQCLFSEPTAT